MKSNLVYISPTMKVKRDRLKETLPFGDFLRGIQSGRWKSFVENARKVRELFGAGSTNYRNVKERTPCVWLQHLPLMVFDWENIAITLHKKYHLAVFKSIGGDGYAVIVKIPESIPESERPAYRKALQKLHGIPSNDKQNANDRVRVVSWDEFIYVNWDSEPLCLPADYKEPEPEKLTGTKSQVSGELSETLKTSKAYHILQGGVIDSNNDGLMVYSHLRNYKTQSEAVAIMDGLKYNSDTLKFKPTRDGYIRKWETAYAGTWGQK